MRINYVLITAGKTGGSIVLYKTMSGLAERGHEVTVTLPDNQGSCIEWLSPKVEIITPRGFESKINRLACGAAAAFSKRFTKLNSYLGLYRTLDDLERIMPDCDINVATYCFTALPVFRSGKGIPFYHMQSYEELLFSDPHLKALAKESYYLPVNKIANSIWLKGQIKEKFGEDVPIVNPGVDLDVFKPRGKQTGELKKRVVCYGSSAKMKGFADAVEAMKTVFKKHKDIEWVVFGLTSPRERSGEAPYSFVQGVFSNRLAELYSSADIVFSPSWLESFPLPPIEAMACGAAVVTTSCGTEDYCYHEDNSLVIPPRQPKLLAEAILRLLEDKNLSEKLRKNGFKTAQRFTWDKTVDKVESLFKQKLH
jgi:glycosyltransferase involved in cell wall biosynthesis